MDAYKTGQGSLARLTVWVSMLILLFLGTVELYSWIQGKQDMALIDLAVFRSLPLLSVPLSWKFLLCVGVFFGLIWLLRRVMTRPSAVDTLVEVEMELKKVSWPTREESMSATWVVVLVTVLITFILFGFDFGLRTLFDLVF